MSLAMQRADGRCCRRLDEAERRPPLLVIPVSKGLACVARLNPKILLVRFSNGFCGGISNVMAVHKEWHTNLRHLLLYFAARSWPVGPRGPRRMARISIEPDTCRKAPGLNLRILCRCRSGSFCSPFPASDFCLSR